MPYYFDSEVPVARRRAGKDLRVYRLRYGFFRSEQCPAQSFSVVTNLSLYFSREPRETRGYYNACKTSSVPIHRFSGPAVISKYVYEPESHYTMKRFIGHNGTLQSYENMAIPPPLQKIDPFGIEGFNQLYSVNKQKRWQVLEIARNDIAALQDPSIKLRVTVMGLPINSKFWSHSPENRVTRPEIGWLSEYHTVDQNGRVISGKTKRTSFSAIRKGENPSRRRKGRLIRPFVHTPVEMPVPVEEQNEIVLWERQAHIIYQEQDAYIPKRMVNTTDKMRAHRTPWDRKNHSRSARFRKKQLYALTCSPLEDIDVDQLEDDDSNLSQPTPFSVSLQQLLCLRMKCPKKRKAREHLKEAEYDKWLLSSPNSDDISVHSIATTDDTYEASNELVSKGSVAKLKSLFAPLNQGNDIRSLAASMNARRIERLQPESYVIDSFQRSHALLDTVLPEDFEGVIVLQRHQSSAVESSGDEIIRIILNDGISKHQMDPSIAAAIQTHRWKWPASKFLPSSAFADTDSFWEQDAERFAFDELIANTPSCSGVSMSDEHGDYRNCGVCCDEAICISLSCGHNFCEDCWISHSTICLCNGRVPIKCPAYRCDNILETEQMVTLLPLSICARYRMLLLKKSMMGHQWIHCPSCPRVMRLRREEQSQSAVGMARCACGVAICLRCRTQAHFPVNCNVADEYRTILRTNGQTLVSVSGEMSVLVKKCPGCGLFCVRAGGCNQIRCKCDTLFCYVCCQKWAPLHYNCSKNVNVRVPLFDVTKMVSHRYPVTVFNKCSVFRQARSTMNLIILKRNLRRLFLSRVDYERIIGVFRAAYEVLEMFVVHMYYLRKTIRRSEGRLVTTLQVHLSSLKLISSSLVFLLNSLRRVCEYDKTTLARVEDLVAKCDHFLRMLLLETL